MGSPYVTVSAVEDVVVKAESVPIVVRVSFVETQGVVHGSPHVIQ